MYFLSSFVFVGIISVYPVPCRFIFVVALSDVFRYLGCSVALVDILRFPNFLDTAFLRIASKHVLDCVFSSILCFVCSIGDVVLLFTFPYSVELVFSTCVIDLCIFLM